MWKKQTCKSFKAFKKKYNQSKLNKDKQTFQENKKIKVVK